MKLRLLLRGSIFATLLALPSFAQPAPPPPTPPAAGEEAVEEPKLPEPKDPMLAPMPPAANVLHSWQEAMRLAKNQASDLAISRAQIDLADGQRRQALSRALPTLTGTGSVTRHMLYGESDAIVVAGFEVQPARKIPDPGTNWNAGLGLRVPVFAPGAWYDYGTAKRGINSAKLSYSDNQRLLLALVADAIVGVVTAERVAEISRVSLSGSLSTLDLNQRRATLGAASSVDVLRAEQEVTITRSQVIAADEGVRKARESLGLAIGTSDSYGVVPGVRVDTLARDARAVCRPVNSVETRADVRAARAQLEIAERNVKSPDYDFIPTIDFVSNLNWFSNEDATPNGKHVTWTIGGVLTWNIYDGGLRYGTKAANEATRRIAQETLTRAKRQARIEAQQARRAVDVAKANLAVSTKGRELAAEGARLSRIAFVAGRGNSFDLIDADRRLREADLDLAVKQFELVRAQIASLLALSVCEA